MDNIKNNRVLSFLGGAAVAGLAGVLGLVVGIIQVGQTEFHASGDDSTNATMVYLLEKQVYGLQSLATLQARIPPTSEVDQTQNTEIAQEIAQVQGTLQAIENESKIVSGTATAFAFQTPTPSKTQPVLIFFGTHEGTVRGETFIYYEIGVSNWADFSSELFEVSSDLNENLSRTCVEIYNVEDNSYIYGFCSFSEPLDLKNFWFTVEKGAPSPKEVYVILNDRKLKEYYISNTIILE